MFIAPGTYTNFAVKRTQTVLDVSPHSICAPLNGAGGLLAVIL